MKVLTNSLRMALLIFGAVFLVACKDQKNVTFTSPENRVKLHSEFSWPEKSYLVIGYHDVNDVTADQRFMSVRTSALREQFAWLRENGYQPISVADIRAAHRNEKTLPKKAVLLTFDDGYQSFYNRVYPLLQAYNWPALWSPVGKWVDTPPDQKVKFGDEYVEREHFSTWEQIAELAKSPLIEIGAHTWNSHDGAIGNPAGSMLPTFANRLYDPRTSTYESESDYRLRIRTDAEKITEALKQHTGRQPTAWVWPYGAQNGVAQDELKKLGYDAFFTLDDGLASVNNLEAIPRILINNNPSLNSFAFQVIGVQEQPAKRSMNVSIDSVYHADEKKFEKKLDALIQNVKDMRISTVFLQTYVTPAANEPVREVYFPNRWLPVRADLFNRIAWQLQTRAGVGVYASMPVANWDFTGGKPLAKRADEESETQKTAAITLHQARSTDANHWQKIRDLYQDLSANNVFHGILFLAEKDREEPERKYAALTSSLVEIVKSTRGYSVKTARQIIAEPGFNPGTDAALSGKINEVVHDYDLTVVKVEPQTNKLPKKERDAWLKLISNQVAHHFASQNKLLIQLEMPKGADSDNNLAAFYDVANLMRMLQLNGVRNYGYNPGSTIIDERQVAIIAPNFSTNWYPDNE